MCVIMNILLLLAEGTTGQMKSHCDCYMMTNFCYPQWGIVARTFAVLF